MAQSAECATSAQNERELYMIQIGESELSTMKLIPKLLLTLMIAGLPSSVLAEQELKQQSSRTELVDDYEIVAWRDRYLMLGQDIYQWACAQCHDTGDNGAPKTGDASAWTTRSPLWSAVLMEHAREGYMTMPARGGHPYLSDRAVQAAGEYMLGKTFPDRLRD